MLETVKLSSKGQLVIPERMRKKLGLQEGTALVLRSQGKQLVLEKEKSFLEELEKLREIQEKKGFELLAQKQLKKIWDNKQDDEEWERYL